MQKDQRHLFAETAFKPLQNISGSAAPLQKKSTLAAKSAEKINFGSVFTENCVFFATKVEMFCNGTSRDLPKLKYSASPVIKERAPYISSGISHSSSSAVI